MTDKQPSKATDAEEQVGYFALEWECFGCEATAPRVQARLNGWIYTDAAWCPECKWLA